MWLFLLIVALLFYFFALLQESFFVHLSALGGIPNLIFAFFFVLMFFENSRAYYHIIFYAVLAGFLLDVFSYGYLGQSMLILLCIALLVKKIQSSLSDAAEPYPLFYFVPLFLLSSIAYEALSLFVNRQDVTDIFSFGFLASLAYSLVFAAAGFYLYKKIMLSKRNGKKI